MPLKFRVKSKDEVPAELQTHYVERDGEWVLDAEGGAEKSKLDEFRNNNVALMKELDELKQRYEGIDPAAVKGRNSKRGKSRRSLRSGSKRQGASGRRSFPAWLQSVIR